MLFEQLMQVIESQDVHIESFKQLIENSQEPLSSIVNDSDENGITLLHNAAWNGNTQIAQILLQHSANIEATEEHGHTPLHAVHGHTQIVQILLQHNANIEATDNNRFTPLYAAASNGHAQIAQILLQHNANIEAKDNDGLTPLHRAAWNGHAQIVHILLQHDANIEAKDNKGLTPLHLAALNGHAQTIQMLIEHKANINAWSRYGTPMNTPISAITKLIKEHKSTNTSILVITKFMKEHKSTDKLRYALKMLIANGAGCSSPSMPTTGIVSRMMTLFACEILKSKYQMNNRNALKDLRSHIHTLIDRQEKYLSNPSTQNNQELESNHEPILKKSRVENAKTNLQNLPLFFRRHIQSFIGRVTAHELVIHYMDLCLQKDKIVPKAKTFMTINALPCKLTIDRDTAIATLCCPDRNTPITQSLS